MRRYLGILFATILLLVPWAIFEYPNQVHELVLTIRDAADQLAAVVVTHNPRTVADLRTNYSGRSNSGVLPVVPPKVRILIVPGHEPDYGGAEFGTLKERDMAVELAQDLRQFLSFNNRYQVFVTRNSTAWDPTFADYFKSGWEEIAAWEQAHKDEIASLTRLGQFTPVVPPILHNKAPANVAMRIFGIDKWANENSIDIVIHIHFNDYPGHPGGVPGDYSGFTIYVPQKEYANSSTTKVLADGIFKRLSKYNPVSNLPGESSGIIEDQDLIAIGAYNSVDAASMLIEYDYLYEPQFTNPSTRGSAIKDLAFQTYLGLQDFFEPMNAVNIAGSFDTLLMPHQWKSSFTSADALPSDVIALQTALMIDGEYPPADRSKNDCPRSGKLGPCTKKALNDFQNKHGIIGEADMVGVKTIDALKKLYPVAVN